MNLWERFPGPRGKQSADPVRVIGVFDYPFSLVPSPFPLPLGPQKSPRGRTKSRKSWYLPPFTSDSVSDIVFDVILSAFWDRFWAHFEDAYPKITLSEANEQKIENHQNTTVFQYKLKVGHPGASSKSIQILCQSSFLFESKNRLEIWSNSVSKMTSKSSLKSVDEPVGRPLGTPWGPLGDLPGPKARNWRFWRSIFGHIWIPEH